MAYVLLGPYDLKAAGVYGVERNIVELPTRDFPKEVVTAAARNRGVDLGFAGQLVPVLETQMRRHRCGRPAVKTRRHRARPLKNGFDAHRCLLDRPKEGL